MPSGTPIVIKCPKCRLGQYGHESPIRGVRKTGITEAKISRSHHQGHGKCGSGFTGHRGQVECGDCGHKWFSTHPASGRISSWKCNCSICKPVSEVT